jgi:hypothetical protein
MLPFVSFLRHCRLRLPARLAVVLTPLAILLCCARFDETRGDIRAYDSHMQAGLTPQLIASALSADGQTTVGFLKISGCIAKSRVYRRIAERLLAISVVNLVVSPSRLVVSIGLSPKPSGASSLGYLLLRQLRL